MHSTRNTFEIQLVSNSTDFSILCTVTTFLQVCKLRKIFQHPNNECICYVQKGSVRNLLKRVIQAALQENYCCSQKQGLVLDRTQ